MSLDTLVRGMSSEYLLCLSREWNSIVTTANYDEMGAHYVSARRQDDRIAALIRSAIGDVQKVVNIGAGTGNYEPTDVQVTGVEPSAGMIAQRPAGAGICVQASAEHLPFDDNEFDVSMAVSTVHHWSDWKKGLSEMERVASKQVIFLSEPDESSCFWLADYFPAMLRLPTHIDSPSSTDVADVLNVTSVSVVSIPFDCTDGFLGSYWRRPSAYLNPEVRSSLSSFTQLPIDAVTNGTQRLAEDLDSGEWDRKYDHLLDLSALDVGYRLISAGLE